MKYYYAIFKKTAEAIEVTFPDLDGCVTFGDTWEEALENAKNVLAGWLALADKIYKKEPSKHDELVHLSGELVPIVVNTKHCSSCTCKVSKKTVPKEEEEKYRSWVTVSLINKISEFQHRLSEIVTACDETMNLFKLGYIDSVIQKSNGENYRLVCYSFSSFSSVVLTLKDSVTTSLEECFPKIKIKKLFKCKHMRFILDSRNAITHDGNSIINGCLNGLYFVGSNIIRRLDNNKELIEIKAPITDIRTLCLEFALDYCMCIHQLFAEAVKNGYKDRKGDISELKQAINESNITPPYIRSIEFDWEEMAKIVNNTEPKTVENIMHNLSEVIDYCKLKTQETAAL